MTAKELIEAAQKCDPEKEVKFCILLRRGEVYTGRLAVIDDQDTLTLFGFANSESENGVTKGNPR